MTTADRAGVVLVDGGGYMLVVRNISSGYWGWPKGRRMINENHIDAAARELLEESSVSINLAGATILKDGRNSIYVLSVSTRPAVAIDMTEINSYDWITPEELMSLPMSTFTRRIWGKVDYTVKKILNAQLDMIYAAELHISGPVCASADVHFLAAGGLHTVPATNSGAG